MVAVVPPNHAGAVGAHGRAPLLPTASHAQVAGALHSSPLMFIENAGQSPDGARFQVRGGDRTIWLAVAGFVIIAGWAVVRGRKAA